MPAVANQLPLLSALIVLAISCGALTATNGLPTEASEITECPTENCRITHRPSDAHTAAAAALQLDAAYRVAATVMEEEPNNSGVTLVLNPNHHGPLAEFRGITGRSARILADAVDHANLSFVSMHPDTLSQLDVDQTMRIMLHETAHYWWRIDNHRGNWLNEWGAIGMEVVAGLHEPPDEPPTCTANWSPSEDPSLHDETGRCVRSIGEYAMRLVRQALLEQNGPSGIEAMRRAYRALYGKALENRVPTPSHVGEHFAQRITDPKAAQEVRQAFGRLR